MRVNLNSTEKVRDFCALCVKCPEEVDVLGGRYVVSGKSIMGVFSLDLTNPVEVEFHGNVPFEVIEGMKKFIVN